MNAQLDTKHLSTTSEFREVSEVIVFASWGS
jgi:hypothetical protein